jgi:NTP pyrophosphatase (non-canonical NTP hydrolase)
MQAQDLTKINQYFTRLYPDLDQRTLILARVAKITEELGEFSNEVLSSVGLQPKRKLDKYLRDNLEGEYADLLLAILLLGNYLEIDTDKVLSQKIASKLVDYDIK